MKNISKKVISILLVVCLIFSLGTTAFATDNGINNTNPKSINERYDVTEIKGIRTVIDKTNGTVIKYDTNKLILTVRQNNMFKPLVIDVRAEIANYYTSTRSGSASSNGNKYAYSATGNPAFWTLQIPNKIKFTYERNQSTYINLFVSRVDGIIDIEDDLILMYGAGVIALFAIALGGPVAAVIIGVLGASVDTAAIISSLTSLKSKKDDAKYYYGKIVTYSTP